MWCLVGLLYCGGDDDATSMKGFELLLLAALRIYSRPCGQRIYEETNSPDEKKYR